jgi:aerobic carbon-monoxide dehydrogenase medium subunit
MSGAGVEYRGVLLREVEYARPATIDEAIRLLAEHDGARALAGGQTLVNVMKARAASPDVLVDLADLADLRRISFSADQSALEIGAMVTSSQIVASSEVEVARPILAEVASTIADLQVRNRGTIGGNICVNDPTNHFPPLLVALGASMTIQGRDGDRTVSAEEFFLGVYLTAVGEGELLTRVLVPTRSAGNGDAMTGVTLGAHGTYVVSAAATVGPDGVRVAIGCVSSVPVRAVEMEQRLAGGDYSEASVKAAAVGLGASLDPPSDVHASADYRRHLAEVSAVRAVLQAAERARG